MAVNFPVTVVIPNYPYDMSRQFKTVQSEFDGGQEQRRQQWRFSKRTVTHTYSALSITQFSTLWDFYQDRTGILGTFNLFEPDVSPYNTTDNSHRDEYVARGNDVSTSFDMAGVAVTTAATTILINGVVQTSGYSIDSAGGDGGVDLLRFTSNIPSSTAVFTQDFKGRLRLTVRFTEDTLTRSQFHAALFQVGLSFTEVKKSS